MPLADLQRRSNHGLVYHGGGTAALRDDESSGHASRLQRRGFRAPWPVLEHRATGSGPTFGRPKSGDDDRILLGDAAVEVDDVLVDQPHAARRHRLADAPPFGRSV